VVAWGCVGGEERGKAESASAASHGPKKHPGTHKELQVTLQLQSSPPALGLS